MTSVPGFVQLEADIVLHEVVLVQSNWRYQSQLHRLLAEESLQPISRKVWDLRASLERDRLVVQMSGIGS